jgi:hypothetical protein
LAGGVGAQQGDELVGADRFGLEQGDQPVGAVVYAGQEAVLVGAGRVLAADEGADARAEGAGWRSVLGT